MQLKPVLPMWVKVASRAVIGLVVLLVVVGLGGEEPALFAWSLRASLVSVVVAGYCAISGDRVWVLLVGIAMLLVSGFCFLLSHAHG